MCPCLLLTSEKSPSSFERAFAASVQRALEREVERADGDSAVPRGVPERLRLEREWFIDRFPLLSGIISRFRFIYDVDMAWGHGERCYSLMGGRDSDQVRMLFENLPNIALDGATLESIVSPGSSSVTLGAI